MTTPTLREAAQAALDALESLQGGCTDSNDGTVEAITVRCPEVIESLRSALAAQPAQALQPLTEQAIEAGRQQVFSTGNPFCPCDSKTMRKAVRWAEAAHGITAATKGK